MANRYHIRVRHILWIAILACGRLAADQQTRQPTGSIEGIVLGENGQPLEGAKISASDGSRPGGARRYVTSDPQGHFYVSNLHPGDWTLFGSKIEAGYIDQIFAFSYIKGQKPLRVQVKEGARTSAVSLTLGPRAAFVHIDLLDEITRKPITDLVLEMEQVALPGIFVHSRQSAPADILIPATTVKLLISSQGYNTWTASEAGHAYITFKSGEHRTLTILLKRTIIAPWSMVHPTPVTGEGECILAHPIKTGESL